MSAPVASPREHVTRRHFVRGDHVVVRLVIVDGRVLIVRHRSRHGRATGQLQHLQATADRACCPLLLIGVDWHSLASSLHDLPEVLNEALRVFENAHIKRCVQPVPPSCLSFSCAMNRSIIEDERC